MKNLKNNYNFFYICYSRRKNNALEIGEKISQWLNSNNYINKLIEAETNLHSMIRKKNGLIISIGGDGTFLLFAREAVRLQMPIAGVNAGRVGFLNEISPQNFEFYFNKIFKKEYTIQDRLVLKVDVSDKKQILDTFFAINDVVLTRGSLGRMLKVDIDINENNVETFNGDGIILSTPTGSTAYNLSAGGPVLTPELEGILITPICPHNLHTRTLVCRSEDKVRLNFGGSRSKKGVLSVDGQVMKKINQNKSVLVTKNAVKLMVVNFGTFNFFKLVKEKLTK
ncbi:MAG: NAD(+)/NADH kinase [Candidatus Muiribacteriota bacterium]